MILAIPCPGHYFRLPLNACARSLASALWRIVRQAGAHTRSLPLPRERQRRELSLYVYAREDFFIRSFIQSSQSVSYQYTSTDQLIPTTTADCASPTPLPSFPSSPHPPLPPPPPPPPPAAGRATTTSTTTTITAAATAAAAVLLLCAPLPPPFGGRSADWELSVVCRGPASPRRWWGSFHDPSRLVSTLQDRDATRRAASQCQSPHESGQDLTGQTDASQKRRSEVRFGSTRVSRGLLWPML